MDDYLRRVERNITGWGDPPITDMRSRDVFDRMLADGYPVGEALAMKEQIDLIHAGSWTSASTHRD